MPPKKPSSFKSDDPESTVLDFLERSGRPFGSTDVFNCLQGAVSKTAVAKALTSLAERDEITAKAFGKSTIYFPKQRDEDCPPPDQMIELDIQLANLKSSVPELQSQVATLTRQLQQVTSTPPTADLLAQVTELREQHARLCARLDVLRPAADGQERVGPPPVTPEAKLEAERERFKYRGTWVQRKRWFKEMWGAVTENLEAIKPADLAEELDIVTDEAAGQLLDDIPNAPVAPAASVSSRGKAAGKRPSDSGDKASSGKKRKV
ncbi:Tat binding protein 1-interacting protein-domain-containing protein [Catenaria anguillulae PL171]|uniref:Tat binding protein 1-interacting protein-domain-containing protein n=1 Tax=Catenaria anguillulae PL171 TaxID=765915 RepID=A0A1Y2HJF8_9FUNG|nr:Tat binding protein 1-interacting protein-domain-containing protein [Catenaria anguillulae PL171]